MELLGTSSPFRYHTRTGVGWPVAMQVRVTSADCMTVMASSRAKTEGATVCVCVCV